MRCASAQGAIAKLKLTSKFEWTLGDIRIEKIITAPIWGGFSSPRCSTLSQAAILCNIKGKY